jgi:phosphoglycolate phosphatase
MQTDFTKLSRPKAILFDWDNTLTNSWPIMHHSLNETLQYFSQPLWTMDEVKSHIGLSMKDTFPKIFGEKWQEAGNVYYRKYLEFRDSYLSTLPDSEEMLKELRKQSDLFIGIISNKRGDLLREEVNKLEWNHYFDVIVGSTDAKNDKPSKDVVDFTLNSTSIKSTQAWLIGDSEVDILCAHNAGCVPILFSDNPIVEQRQPDIIKVNNHKELIELFKLHL